MNELSSDRCIPCEGGVPSLTMTEIKPLLAQIAQWQLSADEKKNLSSFRI